MLNYLIRRMIMALGTLVVLSVIAFIIIQLPPGDYVTAYIGILEDGGDVVTDDREAALRDQYGLNQPDVRSVLQMGVAGAHAAISASRWNTNGRSATSSATALS